MGWNVVRPTANAVLFDGLDNESRFYFVHSYHVACRDQADVAATCEYGYSFPCAVARKNIFATQFHPEKSHKFGMRLLQNFLGLTC
ncbi:Imidazole glycerol phosphate synthase subunit HisH OS=Castellaniella defragrans OX=75697 GN=hisH PE=3 SV=1 [Castellaniella defragrans]